MSSYFMQEAVPDFSLGGGGGGSFDEPLSTGGGGGFEVGGGGGGGSSFLWKTCGGETGSNVDCADDTLCGEMKADPL